VAIVDVEFRSEALGHDVRYSVLLPETGAGSYPALLQLHGLGDSHRAWIDKSMLAMHVRDYPMAVIMPDTGTDSYLNWKTLERLHRHSYEDYIMQDLLPHVQRHFNIATGPWAIGGLSMGGFGSMRLGIKYPETFASIWSHSSAFVIHERLRPDQIDEAVIRDADVHALASALKNSGNQQPVITFDCGVDDELLESNRAFASHLTSIGLEHAYHEYPGGHTWDYWDEHVRKALVQHAEVLGITRSNP
jgi:S-formylglutathione hydrolase FrmB